ncbi:hypothetical protein BLNAU_9382 [Blattamonas nauphoetae]|uniref:Uncharacterized protein n=1 Tax=Blattamonas nauphoetae TaxID=2049346 RepID=A0ABQ9XW31_9EUKA|nr:hypothetical protein BLNAU_9382 [Blattamonas nauphoetae]
MDLNPPTDGCLTDPRESPSTMNTLLISLLTFDAKTLLSFEDKSTIYCSLVALVKADYPFDQALQDAAVKFLKKLEPKWYEQDIPQKLVTDLVPNSNGSHSGFIDSILTLLSSPHSTVVSAALSFLYKTFVHSSFRMRCCLLESDLLVNLLATLQPRTLSIFGNEMFIVPLVRIIINGIHLVRPFSLILLNITTPLDPVSSSNFGVCSRLSDCDGLLVLGVIP